MKAMSWTIAACAALAAPAAAAPCMPAFTLRQSFVVGRNFGMSALADFDGDGDLDLATGVFLFLNDGDGWFRERGIRLHEEVGWQRVLDAVAADFDGDGLLDLAICFLIADTARIWFLHGREQPGVEDGFSEEALEVRCIPGSWHMVLSDFDEDGRPDVFAVGTGLQEAVLVLNRGGRRYRSVIISELPTGGRPIAAGDFDGDGHADIIFGQAAEVTLLFGRGDGTFAKPIADRIIVAGNPWEAHRFRAADIDGDGRADLVAAGEEEAILYWGHSIAPAAGLPSSAAVVLPVDGMARFVEIADINADAVLDIIALSLNSQDVARIRLFAGERGESGLAFVAGKDVAVSGVGFRAVPAVGDLDNDGAPDIAIIGEDTLRGQVFLNDGSCLRRAARGDANADGSLDLGDPIAALGYLISGVSIPCPAAVEVNGDARLDIGDPIYLLMHLFASGPAPAGESPVACR